MSYLSLQVQEMKPQFLLLADKLHRGEKEEAALLFQTIFDKVAEQNNFLQQSKSDRSEIRELILEMRAGFQRVDQRFEAMEKRFETIDKRFDDLIHMIDKRFEAVDKRFEAVDKRFDDMHKRFVFMQWVMLFGFTVLGVAMTLMKFLQV